MGTEKGKAVPRKLTALFVCILGWLGSLLFCPSWGFTHFDVADRYISVYLMFVLGIMQCFAAGWMFRASGTMADPQFKMPVMLTTFTYWGLLLIMAPVTVFGFGAPINVDQDLRFSDDYAPVEFKYVGLIIFWGVMLIVTLVTFLMKGEMTAETWYRKVFLLGAWELADLVADRSD